MGINFPSAPTPGQLYPDPAQIGIPQYKWDGVVWVAMAQEPLTFVKKSGDTMSGPLSLPNTPSPLPAYAIRKDYLDTAIAGIPAPATTTVAEYLANSAPSKMLTSGTTWGAAMYATVADSATVTLNLSLGIDFVLALGAGRTMANPINGKPGQKGLIYITSGTVTTWGSNWKFPSGVKPISSGYLDILSYVVGGDSATIFCTGNSDFR